METMTKTVKMNQEVRMTAKKFFGSRYETRDLMLISEIEKAKKEREANAIHRGNHIKFFKNDGIEFYTYTITNEDGLTTINEIKSYGVLSGGEMWKFGFVTEDGQIVMLFDNQYVAKGRKDAIKMFEHVNSVIGSVYQGKVTPFATKN